MFKRWTKKRILKKMQEECFHSYHIISEYKMDTENYSYSRNIEDFFDMYCPKCDKTVFKVNKRRARRELEKQHVRDSYLSNEGKG